MTLLNEGIKLKSQSIGNHKTTCPKCSHTRRNKRDLCLSVKIDDDGGAVWKCHNCGWAGNIAGAGFTPKPREVRKITLPDTQERDDKFYSWFDKRGIFKQTVDYFGIYKTKMHFGEGEETCIAFPYRHHGELYNIKYRTADKKFRQEKNARKQFYMSETLELLEQETLIVVEGELDVLSGRVTAQVRKGHMLACAMA